MGKIGYIGNIIYCPPSSFLHFHQTRPAEKCKRWRERKRERERERARERDRAGGRERLNGQGLSQVS